MRVTERWGWWFCWAALGVACSNETSGTSTSVFSIADPECDAVPSARTALGPSSEELARAYEGTYTTTSRTTRVKAGKRTQLPDTELKVTLDARDPEPGRVDCVAVDAPMSITVEGPDGVLAEDIFTTLRWNAWGAYGWFATTNARGAVLIDDEFKFAITLSASGGEITFDQPDFPDIR